MPNETLADLLRSVGVQPSAREQFVESTRRQGYVVPRPRPRTMRSPEERARDPNAGVSAQARQQQQAAYNEAQRTGALQGRLGVQEAYQPALNPDTGLNQAQGALLMHLEPTGAPALVRGYRSIEQGRPWQESAGELAMGGLGLLGMGGVAGSARPRPQLPPRGALSTSDLPTRLPANPPREIGAGGLPIRPSEPFRNSLRGGSDDLREAARRPDPAGLPSLRTATQREDWAAQNVKPNRGYEFRGPQDSRYGVTIEDTPQGAQISLESRTPDTTQYGRQQRYNAGEARSIFERAMAGVEVDMATRGRSQYVLSIPPGLRPQHRRIFEAMAERQARANGWPGYALERNTAGDMVLRRIDEASPSSGAEQTGRAAQASGETLDWLGNDRLIRNPTEADLTRLAELGDEMKYVMDTDGNVYAFSAADAHHNNAMRALRDNGVTVRSLGPGAEVTDPDAAGFIWRNKDGSFAHEDANMRESGPYSAFQQRMRGPPKPQQSKRNTPPRPRRGFLMPGA